MSLDVALEDLNTRLKAGHHRCTVEQRKASLVLRATLVDRSDPSIRRRQRVSLNLPASFASLPEAERNAQPPRATGWTPRSSAAWWG